MARASNEDYCGADDVVSGACCPEDAAPCEYNKQEHRCKEHPKYGLLAYYWTCLPGDSPDPLQDSCARKVIPFHVAEDPCAQA